MDAKERIRLIRLTERIAKEKAVADKYGIIDSSHLNIAKDKNKDQREH